MTNLDLTTELRRRAEQTAEALMEAARAECRRIIGEADARLEARRKAELHEGEKQHHRESRASIAAARQESLRRVLTARQQAIGRVLDRARGLIPNACEQESYRSGLPREVAESLAIVGLASAVVRCNESLEPLVREAARGESTRTSIETLEDGRHGFVVIGDGGRVQVDGTLETRLEHLAPALGIELRRLIEERTT